MTLGVRREPRSRIRVWERDAHRTSSEGGNPEVVKNKTVRKRTIRTQNDIKCWMCYMHQMANEMNVKDSQPSVELIHTIAHDIRWFRFRMKRVSTEGNSD